MRVFRWVLLSFLMLISVGCESPDYDIALVEELKKNKPTIQWQREVDNGTWRFSSGAVAETDEALDNFIIGLAIDKRKGINNTQLDHVKTLVIRLNKLDVEYDHFIESLERDQLYFFIDGIAKKFGYSHQGDITERWREW